MAEAREKRVCVPARLARRPLRSKNYVAPTAYRKLLMEVAFKLRPWDVEIFQVARPRKSLVFAEIPESNGQGRSRSASCPARRTGKCNHRRTLVASRYSKPHHKSSGD